MLDPLLVRLLRRELTANEDVKHALQFVPFVIWWISQLSVSEQRVKHAEVGVS